jgi:hypothetical protein
VAKKVAPKKKAVPAKKTGKATAKRAVVTPKAERSWLKGKLGKEGARTESRSGVAHALGIATNVAEKLAQARKEPRTPRELALALIWGQRTSDADIMAAMTKSFPGQVKRGVLYNAKGNAITLKDLSDWRNLMNLGRCLSFGMPKGGKGSLLKVGGSKKAPAKKVAPTKKAKRGSK